VVVTVTKSGSDHGVLYVAFGERWRLEAKDSLASLRQVSEVPVAIVTDSPWSDEPQPNLFVVRSAGSGFAVKPQHILTSSPFEKTLFIDTDTRIIKDPTPAFGLLSYYDIGVRFGGPQLNEEPDLLFHTQCNSGVILFRRCAAVTEVAQLWLDEYTKALSAQGKQEDLRGLGDQRYLALAIAKSKARPVHLAEYLNFALFESILTYSPLVIVHGHQKDLSLIGAEINKGWDPSKDWQARVWNSSIQGILPRGLRRSDPLLAVALFLRRIANQWRRKLQHLFASSGASWL